MVLHADLAGALRDSGRLTEAREAVAHALEMLEAILGDVDALKKPPGAVIGLRLLPGQALGQLGRPQEAELLLRRLAMEAESLGDYERAVRVAARATISAAGGRQLTAMFALE